jgi:coiled-coil domain-containing protein 130
MVLTQMICTVHCTLVQVVPDDKAVGRKLADDAMYKLEHEKDDKGKSQDARPRIEHISYIQDRVKDDYLANRMLR